MKINTNRSGYSVQTYTSQFGDKVPLILIGSGLEPRFKFDPKTNRPTGEIDAKVLWVYYPKLGVQTVKMPANVELPTGVKDVMAVELVEPEACIVRNNIYVRASGIKLIQ